MRFPGLTMTKLVPAVVSELALDADGRTWRETRPANFFALPRLPARPVLPGRRVTAPPCWCAQTSAAVVYNGRGQPLGLLGGLLLREDRMRPLGWSCCAHWHRAPPLGLDRGGAFAGCPYTGHDGVRGPCPTCLLVNAWGEVLLPMDHSLYMVRSESGADGQEHAAPVPHREPHMYPPGPLRSHLLHQIALLETGTMASVFEDVRRLLSPDVAAELDRITLTSPAEVIYSLAVTIRESRRSWETWQVDRFFESGRE